MKKLLKQCRAISFVYVTIAILFLYSNMYAAKPNIIWIMADDLGYGDLGCYGQQQIKTPCIDSMAEQGVRYTNCYAGATVCAPSRSSLMTGLHTGHATMRGGGETGDEGQTPISLTDFTVAELLKPAGYTTGLIGKWGLGMHTNTGDPARQGFDYYCSVLCQRQAHSHYTGRIYENGNLLFSGGQHDWQDDIFKDKALAFITDNKDKPFFLYLTFCTPHAYIEVPDLGQYSYKTWPDIEKKFAAMVTRLDAHVGAVLSKVRELGLDSNTIIFFTSDNGAHTEGGHNYEYFNSNGPFRGLKRDMWDGGIHVPMIVRWPGKTEAKRTSDFVWAFWDFLPTAAELAGIKAPRGLDGMSVLPDILGNEQAPHTYLYWEHSEVGTNYRQALRMDSVKVVRYFPTTEPTVCNIVRDIDESQDLTPSLSASYVDTIKSILNAVRFPSQSHPRPPMDDITINSMVARYTMDNGGTDEAFGLFPMTWEGTPYFTLGRSGAEGLYVDGKSGYGIIQRNVQADLTISYWLKTPSTGGSSYASATGIVDGYKAGADNTMGMGMVNGNVAVAMGTQVISSAALANDGQWHHVAVTRKNTNGNIILYIDGTQSATATGPVGLLTGSAYLAVGSLSSDNGILMGGFDDLRFYNYVLGANAIKDLADETQPSTTTGASNVRIQAESYSLMSGVELEATADADSGLQIAGLSQNAWAEYRLSVGTAGEYTLHLRVLNTGTAGSLDILANGTSIGTIDIPAQTGWQTIYAPITLATGLQTLRLSVTTGTAMKLNWLEISKGTGSSVPSAKGMHSVNRPIELISGWLHYFVKESGNVTISIYNTKGRLVATWQHTVKADMVNRTTHPRLSLLSGGICFVRIEQKNKQIALKRVTIIR